MSADMGWILKALPGIVLGLTVHEFAHAATSHVLGDSTARDDGRMTLNPLKHIDPWGFLFLIIAGFGWAKPVQINPDACRNPKRDEILVSLAGPVSNLLLAFVLMGFLRLFYAEGVFPGTASDMIRNVLFAAVAVNLGIFVFNLIPIPPLDGSHLYMVFMRARFRKAASYFYRYGMGALFIIILIERNAEIDILPILPLIKGILRFMMSLLAFPGY